MLLIGSRAIRFHFPEFREPVDWDLIGTHAEVERLSGLLASAPQASQRDDKVHFLYGKALVEVAVVEQQPYWALVAQKFSQGPTVNDPILGNLTIPPASFLMITKQCGLIYRIAHWHKNLADLYYLRNQITEIPPEVEALLPHAQEDSRRMFAQRHERVAIEPFTCHPRMKTKPEAELHRLLHEACKLESSPMVERPNAWQGFPTERSPRRVELMSRLFAEEAMVLAGHRVLETPLETTLRPSPELKRYALRCLITSGLPEGWRYFGVNHYREISELIPESFAERFACLHDRRPSVPNACAEQELPQIQPM